MPNRFFEHPILNSPYECPRRHWELDKFGQPTQEIIDARRRAEFITPIPKPKKRKASQEQSEIVFDEGIGISTSVQQYDPNPIINEIPFSNSLPISSVPPRRSTAASSASPPK